MNTKTIFALITTVVLWASAFVGIRVGLQGYSPGGLALLRYGVASLAMIGLYLMLRKRNRVRLRDVPYFLLLGFIGFSVYNVALNMGELTVPAGISSFIVGMIPIFTMILAILFLKEKVDSKAWVGVVVSFLGVTIIAVGEHAGIRFDMGVVYNLIAAISGSIYAVMMKPVLKRYHPIEVTAFSIWAGTLFLSVFSGHLFSEIQTASLHATMAGIYMGIFPATIAYGLWSYALSKVDASQAATFLYFLPVFATVMGYFYLNTVPETLSLIGGVVALLGAIFVNQRRNKKKVPKEALT